MNSLPLCPRVLSRNVCLFPYSESLTTRRIVGDYCQNAEAHCFEPLDTDGVSVNGTGSDVATIHGLIKLHRGSCKSFDVMLESSARVLLNQVW